MMLGGCYLFELCKTYYFKEHGRQPDCSLLKEKNKTKQNKNQNEATKNFWLPGFTFLIWIFTSFCWHLFSYMFSVLFFSLKSR